MSVTLQAATGRQVVIRVAQYPSDSAAARAALKLANEQHGQQGWLVLYVL